MAYNIEEKNLILTEQKLGIVFPKSYRNSIMKNNGGHVISPLGVVWELFSIYDNSDKKRLRKTAVDLIHENKTAWNEYGLPENLYAIGNADGEYLVFKKIKDNLLEDAVYQYCHSYGLKQLATDFNMLTHE